MSKPDHVVSAFTELGLSKIEAEIYVFLLQQDASTGYKIANGVGRSFSNTYKTLSSMQTRGIVLADEGDTKLFRAVAADVLVENLERHFVEQREHALELARGLTRPTGDTRIYQLTTVEQIHDRVRRMLNESEERVLIEIYPQPLELLRDAMEDAAARGVVVAARVYEPAEIAGVTTIVSPFAAADWNVFPSQWIGAYVDGSQYLQASFTPDGQQVHQAVWSASPLLAWSIYSHVNADFHHYAFRPHLMAADDVDDLRARYDELQRVFPVGGDLGYRNLGRQLGYSRDEEPEQPRGEES
ncbi:MAG: hypothetical protein GY838_14030 [bacterium]|nr:hypothetical protein [bacterium]